MGTGKKEATRRERQGKTGDGMGNVRVKGENFYRTAKKAKTLNMFKEGKAQRDSNGKITKAAAFQGRDVPQARVEPNRKWFGNTRVISQDALQSFQAALAEQASSPYSVLLKSNKLPMSLIRDGQTKNGLKEHQAKIAVEAAPFKDTFGPKSQRKRVKTTVSSLEDLVGETEKMQDTYLERLEQAKYLSGAGGTEQTQTDDGVLTTAREPIFSKGQSKRIWNELYKVIDSSDVVIHVLDARDPLGTRCRGVERYIKEEAPHKHLIFVLNKCDLIPTRVAAAWVRALSREYPTLAFHASINNSFGKGSLIALLRQFRTFHKDRKQISVGFIGYPNTGKSSIINTLRKKKVCTVAPIPGETKVWQYITMTKGIYLIDCPGVCPANSGDTEQDILLKGVVRVENVEHPEQYIPAILAKTKTHHIERTYEVKGWTNSVNFLELLARKGGRLLKGGEADLGQCAKMVINDFLRGKIPWFTPPPVVGEENGEVEEKGIDGRIGRLGEMGRKRKRNGEEEPDEEQAVVEERKDENEERSSENELDFEGFSGDEEEEDDDEEDEEVNVDDGSNDSDDDRKEEKDDSDRESAGVPLALKTDR